MNNLSEYIVEKLRINKDTKVSKNSEQLAANVISFINGGNEYSYKKVLEWIENNGVSKFNAYISTSDYDRHLSNTEKELFNFIRNELKYVIINSAFKLEHDKGKYENIVNQKFPYASIDKTDDILKISLKKFGEPIYLTDITYEV